MYTDKYNTGAHRGRAHVCFQLELLSCGFFFILIVTFFFFFSSRRRHTRSLCDWSSDVCFRSAARRKTLPDDISITPCGGTKNLGYLASLFLGHRVRPEIGRASCRERV